jgi:hypothetical protein
MQSESSNDRGDNSRKMADASRINGNRISPSLASDFRQAKSSVESLTLRPSTSPELITGCVQEIKRIWAEGQTRTLVLAKAIFTVRRRLFYGQWSALWRSGKIPFTKRKAEMLVVIGRGLEWIDANTCSHLPSGRRTLYYLAQLDRATLERLISQDIVHPALTRQAARELLAEFKGQQAKETKVNVRRWLRRVEKFVRATLKEWSPQDRQLAEAQLSELIGHIKDGAGRSHLESNQSSAKSDWDSRIRHPVSRYRVNPQHT